MSFLPRLSQISLPLRLNETESFFLYNDEDDQSCEVPDHDKTWHTCSYDLSSNVQNEVDYEGYFLPSPSLPPLSGGNTYASPGKTAYYRNGLRDVTLSQFCLNHWARLSVSWYYMPRSKYFLGKYVIFWYEFINFLFTILNTLLLEIKGEINDHFSTFR